MEPPMRRSMAAQRAQRNSTLPIFWTKLSDGQLTDAMLEQHCDFGNNMWQYRHLKDREKANPNNLYLLNQSLPAGVPCVHLSSHPEPEKGLSHMQGISRDLQQLSQSLDGKKANADSSRSRFRSQALSTKQWRQDEDSCSSFTSSPSQRMIRQQMLRKTISGHEAWNPRQQGWNAYQDPPINQGRQDSDLSSCLSSATSKMTEAKGLVDEANWRDTDFLMQKHYPRKAFASRAERIRQTDELKEKLQADRADSGISESGKLLQALERDYTQRLKSQMDDLKSYERTFGTDRQAALELRKVAEASLEAYRTSRNILENKVAQEELELEHAKAQAYDDKDDAAAKLAAYLEAVKKYELSERQALHKEGQLGRSKLELQNMKNNFAQMQTIFSQEVSGLTITIQHRADAYAAEAKSGREAVVDEVMSHHKKSYLKVFEGLGLVEGLLEECGGHHETRSTAAGEYKSEAEREQVKEPFLSTKRQELTGEIKEHEATIGLHKQRLDLMATYLKRSKAVRRGLGENPNAPSFSLCLDLGGRPCSIQDECGQAFHRGRSTSKVYFEHVLPPLVPPRVQERRDEEAAAKAAAAQAAAANASSALVVAQVQEVVQAQINQFMHQDREAREKLQEKCSDLDFENRELRRKLAAMERERSAERANRENRKPNSD